MAPLFLALRDASAIKSQADQVWWEISGRGPANMRRLIRALEAAGGLRPGLSIDEAADVTWATNSSELYVLITVELGWSPDRHERWLAET